LLPTPPAGDGTGAQAYADRDQGVMFDRSLQIELVAGDLLKEIAEHLPDLPGLSDKFVKITGIHRISPYLSIRVSEPAGSAKPDSQFKTSTAVPVRSGGTLCPHPARM